jgi:hypothetical protein
VRENATRLLVTEDLPPLLAHVERLEAEHDRLREALRRIEKHHGFGNHVSLGCLDGVKDIARAALEEGPE